MRDAHRQARTEIPIVSARSDSEQKDGARRMAFRMPDYDRRVHTHTNLGDILANAITHGIGAALAIAGAVYLIVASTRGSSRLIVSCVVFSGSLVLVYVCSTLYHSLVRTRARSVFRILDHSSIYLLIAGTYTPFTLISLRGPMGWTLFGIVWALAVAGVVAKSVAMDHFTGGFLAVALHGHLPDSGLAGDFCGAIAHPCHRLARSVLAGCRRPCVHVGRCVFRARPDPLLSRYVARLRARRKHRPLLRDPVLRGPGARVTEADKQRLGLSDPCSLIPVPRILPVGERLFRKASAQLVHGHHPGHGDGKGKSGQHGLDAKTD